jgi:hypothetical protein
MCLAHLAPAPVAAALSPRGEDQDEQLPPQAIAAQETRYLNGIAARWELRWVFQELFEGLQTRGA